MDDDDWDLNAVVRGCSATNAAAAAKDHSVGFPPDRIRISSDLEEEENDDGSFQGLYEIYRGFCVDPKPTAAAAVGMERVLQTPGLQVGVEILRSQFLATSQSKRRKNEETRMVHEMTQEEVCGDSWAWRKYGQKPIKGSLYPRNYYRCSTLKACSAKKQVERSPNDPSRFLVSYTGEHTHQRPAHRRYLSGCSVSNSTKLSPAAGDGGILEALRNETRIGSSSPAFATEDVGVTADEDTVSIFRERNSDDSH